MPRSAECAANRITTGGRAPQTIESSVGAGNGRRHSYRPSAELKTPLDPTNLPYPLIAIPAPCAEWYGQSCSFSSDGVLQW